MTSAIRTIALPSGRVLTQPEEYKGKHMMRAQQLSSKVPAHLPAAMAAQLFRLDGEPFPFEAMGEWPGQDYVAALEAVAQVMEPAPTSSPQET